MKPRVPNTATGVASMTATAVAAIPWPDWTSLGRKSHSAPMIGTSASQVTATNSRSPVRV